LPLCGRSAETNDSFTPQPHVPPQTSAFFFFFLVRVGSLQRWNTIPFESIPSRLAFREALCNLLATGPLGLLSTNGSRIFSPFSPFRQVEPLPTAAGKIKPYRARLLLASPLLDLPNQAIAPPTPFPLLLPELEAHELFLASLPLTPPILYPYSRPSTSSRSRPKRAFFCFFFYSCEFSP